ncbi:hypothetical protein Gorai_013402, partial [Gossypium raimondii]|nr:hypothetical protein [Gossypium raimondii]
MSFLSSWSPPETGWFKLNSDGVVSIIGQSASIGGVLRDSNANWLRGYTMSFDKKLAFKVEIRAMLEGLFITWEKGLRKVEVECDNTLLIELILSGGGANSSLVELRLLHQLLRRRWE